MIFFDWKSLPEDDNEWKYLQSENKAAFGIKTAAVIIFILLYLWTLIAPRVLKNREFNQ